MFLWWSFSCPADHVPDWQPRILLGMVEARLVNVKNTQHTHTHTHTHCRILFFFVCMVITYSKGKDQPGKVTNSARDQLNRENIFFAVPVRSWECDLARRVRQSRPASACSSPYLVWIWCLLTGFLPSSAAASIYLVKPPYSIGPVPSLSGHAIAYRWRSLPRVRRHMHRANKPQGSSKRVLPWQVTMDQLICASLSHTHYWYGVGMLKVPACSSVNNSKCEVQQKINKWYCLFTRAFFSYRDIIAIVYCILYYHLGFV